MWNGKDIFSLGASYRGILGYLPQNYGFYPDLSVYDYMMYIASIKGLRPIVAKKRALKLLEQVGMAEKRKKKDAHFIRGNDPESRNCSGDVE